MDKLRMQIYLLLGWILPDAQDKAVSMMPEVDASVCLNLIRQAQKKHGNITPCAHGFPFTEMKGKLTFWYNDTNNSTHIVSA
jgi:hypothetical protein